MTASTRRTLQPVFVALLVAAVSAIALVALVRTVFVTGGGIALPTALLLVATAALAALLGLLLKRTEGRSRWTAAVVLALVDLAVFVALSVTGTQRASIVMLGPELVIVAVALATGAASAVTRGGRWRALGIAGVVALLWLAVTPVLVAL